MEEGDVASRSVRIVLCAGLFLSVKGPKTGAESDGDVSSGMNEAQMLVRVLQHLEANDRKIDELQRHLHAQMPVPMPQRNGELHESSNAG